MERFHQGRVSDIAGITKPGERKQPLCSTSLDTVNYQGQHGLRFRVFVLLLVLSEPALISQLCDLVCVLFAPDLQFVMCQASFRQLRCFRLSLLPIILHPPIFPGNLIDSWKSWLPKQECLFTLCVGYPVMLAVHMRWAMSYRCRRLPVHMQWVLLFLLQILGIMA